MCLSMVRGGIGFRLCSKVVAHTYGLRFWFGSCCSCVEAFVGDSFRFVPPSSCAGSRVPFKKGRSLFLSRTRSPADVRTQGRACIFFSVEDMGFRGIAVYGQIHVLVETQAQAPAYERRLRNEFQTRARNHGRTASSIGLSTKTARAWSDRSPCPFPDKKDNSEQPGETNESPIEDDLPSAA